MFVKRSISKAKSRSNVESDLLFNGTDQQTESPLTTVTSDFSMAFFDDRGAAQNNKTIFHIGDDNADFVSIRTGFSGALHPYGVFIVTGGDTFDALSNTAINGDRENQDWLNKKTSIVINFIQSQTKIECWVNGVKEWEHIDVLFTGKTIDGKVIFANFHSGASNYNGKISHGCIFNDILTEEEIIYFDRNGGLVPESAHENCIAHYPLTERYAFKADAAFIVKHPQFIVGDNVFFDVVEQYNYAKVTPLTANHAKAVNFTDAELGTGGDVRTQSVKKNFYDKNTNVWYNGAGDPDPSNMTETESGFEPITEGLLIETGISIADTYTSIVGMGFTIQLLTDIAALSEIITGLPTITKFRINGNEVTNESALIVDINNNNVCHIDLEWANASPTITFVHSGEDYYLIRDYYLDSVLTQKEVKQLTNNLIFSNPKSGVFQEKFNYYALHNEGNYTAGATNPENVPLIDADTIGNRESLGWTGGDAATKLADLITNLSDIEQLR